MKREVRLKFVGIDKWSRFSYVVLGEKSLFKMVDGELHTTTCEGEPLSLVSDKKCDVTFTDDLPHFVRFSRDCSTITVEYKGQELIEVFDKIDTQFMYDVHGSFSIGIHEFELHTVKQKDETLYKLATKLGRSYDNCYEWVHQISRPMVEETCAECEEEVMIGNHFGPQNCPKCNTPIQPCDERAGHPDMNYTCDRNCQNCGK